MFSWHKSSYERRVKWAKRRYRPFAQWQGVVRHAKSTGKPHYYVKCADGKEAAITFKSERKDQGLPKRYLLHYPAYAGTYSETYTDVNKLNSRLLVLGAIPRHPAAS
jgi:hypothetical protein